MLHVTDMENLLESWKSPKTELYCKEVIIHDDFYPEIPISFKKITLDSCIVFEYTYNFWDWLFKSSSHSYKLRKINIKTNNFPLYINSTLFLTKCLSERLHDNYKIIEVNISIGENNFIEKVDTYVSMEFERNISSIKNYVQRNKKGFEKCKRLIYFIIAARKFGNSTLNIFPKEIVKYICEFILLTLGDPLWIYEGSLV